MTNTRLQIHIDEGLKSDLLLTHLAQGAAHFNFDPIDLENLNVKKTILVVCSFSQLEKNYKRFRYYKNAWYIVGLDEPYDETRVPTMEKVFFIPVENTHEVDGLIRLISNHADQLLVSQQEQEIGLQWNKIITEASRYLEMVMNTSRFDLGRQSQSTKVSPLAEIVSFMNLKRELYKYQTAQELISFINESFQNYGIVSLKIMKSHELEGLPSELSRQVFTPFAYKNLGDYLCWEYAVICDSRLSFFIYLLSLNIEKISMRDSRLKEMNQEDSLWESAFACLEQPFVMIAESAEIILHNNEFSKLGILPKECLQLRDGEQIDIGMATWMVKKENVLVGDAQAYLILFDSYPNDEHKNLTSSELGIISGSLAHELNNPIAGILSAIQVLELEDHWDQDSWQSLNDMKESAKRCKELVEIFLGFSQASTSGGIEIRLQDSLNQALKLLRFRMMESELRLDIECREQNVFQKVINNSVMTMIFYLLLSDILTHFSHINLVDEHSGREKNLKGTMVETEFSANLKFSQTLFIPGDFQISKLLKHLLDLEGLSVEIDKNQLRIVRTSLL